MFSLTSEQILFINKIKDLSVRGLTYAAEATDYTQTEKNIHDVIELSKALAQLELIQTKLGQYKTCLELAKIKNEEKALNRKLKSEEQRILDLYADKTKYYNHQERTDLVKAQLKIEEIEKAAKEYSLAKKTIRSILSDGATLRNDNLVVNVRNNTRYVIIPVSE